MSTCSACFSPFSIHDEHEQAARRCHHPSHFDYCLPCAQNLEENLLRLKILWFFNRSIDLEATSGGEYGEDLFEYRMLIDQTQRYFNDLHLYFNLEIYGQKWIHASAINAESGEIRFRTRDIEFNVQTGLMDPCVTMHHKSLVQSRLNQLGVCLPPTATWLHRPGIGIQVMGKYRDNTVLNFRDSFAAIHWMSDVLVNQVAWES
ncbi:MAG: hypothetical protein HQL31_10185 [Planctomycetes bacterium]|nr:hypothetical protein [Planctomycetota bacterium]